MKRGPSKYFDKVTDLFSDYEHAEIEDEDDLDSARPERQVSIINDWHGQRKKKEAEKDYIIEQWEEEDEFENMDKYLKKGKMKEIGLEEYAMEEVQPLLMD
jgi:hypothetical protein